MEQSSGAGSALNVATDRIVESGINGFQLGMEDSGTVVKRRCDGLCIGEEGIELVEGRGALAEMQ